MSKIGWCGDVSGGPWGPSEPPDEPACPECGNSDIEWVECWQCLGDGEFDLYEEDPIFYAPGQKECCDECGGAGGWNACHNCESGAEPQSCEPQPAADTK